MGVVQTDDIDKRTVWLAHDAVRLLSANRLYGRNDAPTSSCNNASRIRKRGICVRRNKAASKVADVRSCPAQLDIVDRPVQTHNYRSDICVHGFQSGNILLVVVLPSIALDSNGLQLLVDPFFTNDIYLSMVWLRGQILGCGIG